MDREPQQPNENDSRPPVITLRSSYVEAREGEPAVLRCDTDSSSSSSPDSVRVEWMNPRGEYLPSEGDGSLIIYNARPSHNGYYVCTVTNQYGSARAQLQLQIAAADEPKQEIRVQVTPKTKSASVGGNADFVCTVLNANTNEPLLRWSRAGGLSLPAYHSINGNVLRIQDIREEDAGRYQCTAQSSDGSISFDAAYLQISKKDPNSAFPVFIRVLEAPTDSYQPTAEFRYGVKVTAECVAQTQDIDDVTWSKESGVNRATFDKKEFNANTMTIPALLAMDLGTYVCIATTRGGLKAQNSIVFTRSTHQNNQFTYSVKGPSEPVSEQDQADQANEQQQQQQQPEQGGQGHGQGQEQNQQQGGDNQRPDDAAASAEPRVEIVGEKQIRTFEGDWLPTKLKFPLDCISSTLVSFNFKSEF